MERKQICRGSVSNRLPLLSSNNPWFVAQNLEAQDDTGVQIFYTVHDPLSHYHCRIPQLFGNCIRGCFHGWVILSSYPCNVMWSLWNPKTSKIIRLPPLKDGYSDNNSYCCLSSPPDDPNSVILLTRSKYKNFVFCRLDRKKNSMRWAEVSYATKMRNIFGVDGFLHYLTCCNGKVYALVRLEHVGPGGRGIDYLVQLVILVNDRGVVIRILPVLRLPRPPFNGFSSWVPYLKGSCTELFTIYVVFKDETRTNIGFVYLFKLNMISMKWEKMEDLKDTIFFVELDSDLGGFYSPAVPAEIGGYIHILHRKGNLRYLYHVKDKTISQFYMPCVVETSHMSVWVMPGCKLSCDHKEPKGTTYFKQKEDKGNKIMVRPHIYDEGELNNTANESHLLNIPFHLLETIMEFCVGVEYIKFRATSKHCELAAPIIQRRNETVSKRLQTYSCISPWLMVTDQHQDIITFTDPMFGDRYFVKTLKKLICDFQIHCSKYGWLLIRIDGDAHMIFLNPFTSKIIELPRTPYAKSYCFSAPPTSPDCLVVAISDFNVWIHFVARESSFRRFDLDLGDDDGLHSFRFITFFGRDLYALCNNGEVNVFKQLGKEDYSWDIVIDEAPTSSCTSFGQQFMTTCDQHILLIIVHMSGQSIEVFRSNDDEAKWEKIDSLGSHMIYICDSTCICIEAKTPKMENKIYFPQLDCEKVVFYSLETSTYHTFSDKNIQENVNDFLGIKHHLSPHAWIEPSWS